MNSIKKIRRVLKILIFINRVEVEFGEAKLNDAMLFIINSILLMIYAGLMVHLFQLKKIRN